MLNNDAVQLSQHEAHLMKHRGKRARTVGTKLLLCLIALFLSPACAYCQQARVDLAGGYSFLRAYPNGDGVPFNSNGGSASVSFNIKPWLGAVADFSGFNFGAQPFGVHGQLYTYSFGPRLTLQREASRWTPFGEVLIGGARVNGTINAQSPGENGLSLIAGAGLDAALGQRLSWRVAEVDYLLTRFDRVTGTTGVQNDLRISTGLVLHFGRR
jgi:hypothetical protein